LSHVLFWFDKKVEKNGLEILKHAVQKKKKKVSFLRFVEME
jgi:hypothetical protein